MLQLIIVGLAVAALGPQLTGLTSVVEPADPSSARVVLSVDKNSFLLGEPVLVLYCVENTSSRPFGVEFGADYRGGSRANRFKLTVTNAAGVKLPDPDPSGYHEGGVSSALSLTSGRNYCESLALMRYARIDEPGTYTILATHDLGWKKTRPPAGPITVTLTMPTTAQAEQVVTSTLALPELEDYEMGTGIGRKIVRPRQDFSVLRYPVYLPPLKRLADSGNAKVVWGIGAIPTPDATRALIDLMRHPDSKLALDASRILAMRLPDPALDGKLSRRGPFGNELEDPRRYLRDAGWRDTFASDVRSVAADWLKSGDATHVIQAAFMIEAVGTLADAAPLTAALDGALER